MEFLIITGMSGAGKSQAANTLEDLGWYCVDNMPAKLISKFAELCSASAEKLHRVAYIVDIHGDRIQAQQPISHHGRDLIGQIIKHAGGVKDKAQADLSGVVEVFDIYAEMQEQRANAKGEKDKRKQYREKPQHVESERHLV